MAIRPIYEAQDKDYACQNFVHNVSVRALGEDSIKSLALQHEASGFCDCEARSEECPFRVKGADLVRGPPRFRRGWVTAELFTLCC